MIEKKKLTYEQVEKFFQSNKQYKVSIDEINIFLRLNDAIYSGRAVFATSDNYRYFRLYYVDENYQICMVFLPFLMKKKKKNNCYYFYSNAIGMSRVFDATRGVFELLCKMGGCNYLLEYAI